MGRTIGIAAGLAAGLMAAPALGGECGALAALKIEAVNLHSAAEVPASGDLPAYCRVLGTVRPAISVEVRLPLQNWNGKYYGTGCGGFCGTLNADAPGFTNAMNYGLRRGYAASTMDSGHWGTGSVDGRWAVGDLVARMDWGQRAVTETARVSKALVRAFYDRPQHKSYFAGCSTGGRMAAMEALKYPKDFDGIISGAPALDYTGLVATTFAWVTKANTGADGKPILTTPRVKLVADAVAAACGAKETGGLVADPRQCSFKPSSLRCSGDTSDKCLSEAEIGVLEKWYAGPADTGGRALYPGGIPLGSEAHWPRWLTGLGNAPAILPLFSADFLRYMAFWPSPGPAYRVADFDFSADPARMAPQAQVYNAATYDPVAATVRPAADLAPFRDAGGKLLIYHGWGDPLVTPFMSVAFYEALAKGTDGKGAGGQGPGGFDALAKTARLFMVPGMDHCGIGTEGPGISDTGIDPLTALERWVEAGEAPRELVATKRDAGGAVLWSRPVCAYPQVPRPDGAGLSCAAP